MRYHRDGHAMHDVAGDSNLQTFATSTNEMLPALERRGSVLILVVGVLVLLAISATVYMGIGQQERISASSQELSAATTEATNKTIDHIGKLLTDDLYPVDLTGVASRPFLSGRASNFAFGWAQGEYFDYPSTLDTSANGLSREDFNKLSDPHLASTEATDTDGDGLLDTWGHLSNVHPQGLFVDLDKLVDRNSFKRFSIYGGVTITGADPFKLDTPTRSTHSSIADFRFDRQLDDIANEGVDGIPTFEDQRFGTDTDGDGRIDARWTELPGITGFPKGMRIFQAVRVVDASSLINVNTSIELGATKNDDTGPGVAFSRFPTDIDLYSLLLEDYDRLGGQFEEPFAFGSVDQVGSFRNHLGRLGVLAHSKDPLAFRYNSLERTRALSDVNFVGRGEMYDMFLGNPQRPFEDYRPYGIETEIELRSFWGMSNPSQTSRLELMFTNLGDFNPFRSDIEYEVDWTQPQPTPLENFAVQSGRALVTTYNGQRNVRPWNTPDPVADIPLKQNINRLLTPVDDDTKVDLQPLFSAFAWALFPQAILSEKNQAGIYTGDNLYGVDASWDEPSSNVTHYGAGTADFAYLRAGQLALNSLDAFDSDSDPTVRLLRYDKVDTRDEETELNGLFDHGEMHADGVLDAKDVVLIGVEKQPFFREAAYYQVWSGQDLDGDQFWEIDTDASSGIPETLVFELIAFELGNPWDEAIDITEFEIVIPRYQGGFETIDLADLDVSSIDAGDSIIVARWAHNTIDGGEGQVLKSNWERVILARAPNQFQPQYIEGNTDILLPNDPDGNAADFEKSVSLWRKGIELNSSVTLDRVMVDRIEASEDGDLVDERFPGTLSGGTLVYQDFSEEGEPGFAILYSSSVRRATEPSAESFPPFILQSPMEIENLGQPANGREEWEGYQLGQNDFRPPPDIFERASGAGLVDLINMPTDQNKGYPAGYADTFHAPFQMHVWNNEDIQSPFDLLMVNSVGHVYVPFVPTSWETEIDNVANGGRFITMSEMLGDEALRTSLELTERLGPDYFVHADQLRVLGDTTNTSGPQSPDTRLIPSTSIPNHFVGKTDYTRYIPGSRQSQIPMGLRIVDTFDVNDYLTANGLVQGRININTAPRRVLEALPFLEPRYTAGPIRGRENSPGLAIADAIIAYRDRHLVYADPQQAGMNWSNRAIASNLLPIPGGKYGQLRSDVGQKKELYSESGITSLGELALITEWDVAGGVLGVNSSNQPPADPRALVLNGQTMVDLGSNNLQFDYEALIPSLKTYQDTESYDPTDDVTEWLLQSRNISNVISLRSDVYIAYIKVIGVTPADVSDAIQKKDDGMYTSELAALQPSLEQRYVVIFDRSNVNHPSDRPRVLFAAQRLPIR